MSKPTGPPGKPGEPGKPPHAGKPDQPGKSGGIMNMPTIRDSTQEYRWAATERITVSTSSVGFTAATYKPTSGDFKGMPARIAKFTVEGADIRTQESGAAPTTSTGKVIYETGSDTVLGSQNIKNFRAIRDGGTDATIDVRYGW